MGQQWICMATLFYRVTVDFCHLNGQLFSKISQKSEKIKLQKRTPYKSIALIPVIFLELFLICYIKMVTVLFFIQTIQLFLICASVHEGKRPYFCPKCDYSSAHKGNLTRHIESVHEG